MNRSRRLATTIFLGAAMQLVPCSAADAQHQNAAPEKQTAAKASPAGFRHGTSKGIKVHGKWTITVRNADGAVATRHEFENALNPQAGPFLAAALARGATVGHWQVTISGGLSTLCDAGGGSSSQCFVAEPGFHSQAFLQVSPTLSVAAPQSGPDAGKFVLSGTTRATKAGTVAHVTTEVRQCAATVSPANPCLSGPVSFFTGKTLAPGIPVVAGQAVDVTVVISFS